MDFTRIYLAGASAMGVFLVFDAFRRKGWIGNKTLYSVVLLFVVLWNVGDFYYSKIKRNKQSINKIEENMLKAPMMQVLKQYDQELFYQLRDKMVAMNKNNKTDQEVFNELLIDFVKTHNERFNFAPDQDIISLTRLSRDQIVYAKGVSDDFCFRFSYPLVSGGMKVWLDFPESILQKRKFLEAELVRNSYGINKHMITSDETSQARKDYDNMASQLNLKYGTDLEIMSDPKKGLKKKKIACEISEDMLNYILSLPAERSAGIYRLIMSLN